MLHTKVNSWTSFCDRDHFIPEWTITNDRSKKEEFVGLCEENQRNGTSHARNIPSIEEIQVDICLIRLYRAWMAGSKYQRGFKVPLSILSPG